MCCTCPTCCHFLALNRFAEDLSPNLCTVTLSQHLYLSADLLWSDVGFGSRRAPWHTLILSALNNCTPHFMWGKRVALGFFNSFFLVFCLVFEGVFLSNKFVVSYPSAHPGFQSCKGIHWLWQRASSRYPNKWSEHRADVKPVLFTLHRGRTSLIHWKGKKPSEDPKLLPNNIGFFNVLKTKHSMSGALSWEGRAPATPMVTVSLLLYLGLLTP